MSGQTMAGATIDTRNVECTDTSQRVPMIVTSCFLAGITRMAFKAETRGKIHRDGTSIICQRGGRTEKNLKH